MSGPKLSEVELAALRRRQEEERRLEEERRRLVQDQYRRREVLSRRINEAQRMQIGMLSLLTRPEIASANLQIEQLQIQAKKTASTEVEHFDTQKMRQIIASLDAFLEKQEAMLTKTTTLINKEREEQYEAAMREYTHANSNVKTTREDMPKEDLEHAILRIRANLKSIEDRQENLGRRDGRVETISERIDEILSESGRKNIDIFEDLHREEVFRINPLLCELEKQEEYADALDEKLSEELAVYHSLCTETNTEPRDFAFSEESIPQIRSLCADMLKKKKWAADAEFIMNRVEEELRNMGYECIGTKQEDVLLCRRVYRLHDKTVLRVIYDSEGHMTMEVGFEDNCEREPYPVEAAAIVREQIEFCKLYDTLLAKLNDGSMEVNTTERYPCGEEYAIIINTSDYDRSTEEKRDRVRRNDRRLYANRRNKYQYMS